jgi:hypothetical protein
MEIRKAYLTVSLLIVYAFDKTSPAYPRGKKK